MALNSKTIDERGMARLQLGPNAVLSFDFAQVILIHNRNGKAILTQMLRPPGTALATRGFVHSYYFPELLCHGFARRKADRRKSQKTDHYDSCSNEHHQYSVRSRISPFNDVLRQLTMMLLCMTTSALRKRVLRNAPAALEPEPREQHHGTQ
jgi:hypothetical protein